MRTIVPLVTILSFGFASVAGAQGSGGALEARLKAIDPKKVTETDCTAEVARAATLNGPDLIYGGQVCEAAKKPVESSFLMAIGQMRASADMLVMPPATQADDQSLMPLYGMLWAGGGVSGISDEVLRDPATRGSLFKLLDGWSPAYGPNYDPGWTARKRPDAAKYLATIAEAKAGIRQYADMVVRLVSDDEYYAAHSQYMQILKRIPADGLSADAPDAKRLDELQSQKRARAIALGIDVGPDPSEAAERAKAELSIPQMGQNFPPPTPDKEETIISGSADPTVVERCLDMAERSAVSRGGKIVGVLITSSSKWGTIWRGDISGSYLPGVDELERFTCTRNTSASQPVEMGGEALAPLPAQVTATAPSAASSR